MSIASIGLINNLDLNNVSLGTNGQISSNGTFANLYMSNDEIPSLSGVPYATWNMGVFSGTDPNYPNALTFAVATNDPVAPTVDAIALLPSGGGNTGNGTQVQVGGDLLCGGDLITSIPSATSLATDSNGKIIAGGSPTPTNLGWKLNANTFIDQSFTNSGSSVVDSSWVQISLESRMVFLFINWTIKVVNIPANTASFTILTNPNWTSSNVGELPPPNGNYQDMIASNIAQIFAPIQLIDNTTAPTAILSNYYLFQSYNSFTGNITLQTASTISNVNVDDEIVVSGLYSYPF